VCPSLLQLSSGYVCLSSKILALLAHSCSYVNSSDSRSSIDLLLREIVTQYPFRETKDLNNDILKSSACQLLAHTTIYTNLWHELWDCLQAGLPPGFSSTVSPPVRVLTVLSTLVCGSQAQKKKRSGVCEEPYYCAPLVRVPSVIGGNIKCWYLVFTPRKLGHAQVLAACLPFKIISELLLTNCFVSTRTNSMKCLVNWIPLRSWVLSSFEKQTNKEIPNPTSTYWGFSNFDQ